MPTPASLLSHLGGIDMSMKSTPPAPTTLTLFDASQFEFDTDPAAKTPSRPSTVRAPVATPRASRFGGPRQARGDPTNRHAVLARRQRARARVAKRRYLADSEGYERLLQTQRGLHLVAD